MANLCLKIDYLEGVAGVRPALLSQPMISKLHAVIIQ
jgi:hypothetical protein